MGNPKLIHRTHTTTRRGLALAISCVMGASLFAMNAGASDAFDFNYQVRGAWRPNSIFDDGQQTYFQTNKEVKVFCDNGVSRVKMNVGHIGPYYSIPNLCEKYYLNNGDAEIEISYIGYAKNSARLLYSNQPRAIPAVATQRASFDEGGAFMPLRRVYHIGAPAVGAKPAGVGKDISLLNAIAKIVPNDFTGYLGRELYSKQTKVSYKYHTKWYDAIETLAAEHGFFAEINWPKSSITITENFKLLSGFNNPLLAGTPKTETVSSSKRDNGSGSAASGTRTPNGNSDSHGAGSTRNTQTEAKTASGKPGSANKREPEPSVFTMRSGSNLSENLDTYLVRSGYTLSWESIYDARVKRDISIPVDSTVDIKKLLSLLLRPAGMRAVINTHDRLIVIQDA